MKKGISSLFPVSCHDAAATLTGASGRSLWTLTNSAGGALALTGGGSRGRAGGGGGGGGCGGGGGDASVTYSDRSVSSWGEGDNRSRPIRAENSCGAGQGGVTATWRHTHTG